MAFDFTRFTRRGPTRIDEEKVTILDLPLQEWGMVAVYVLFATAWIGSSHLYLDWLEADPLDSPGLQAMNALNFILTSGILLYAVLRRSYQCRRRAREASRLSQNRFEAVALATTDAIWDWNLDTNSVWWSEGFQHLFGYAPGDITPDIDWWLGRLHPDDKERVVDGIHAVINGGGRMWSGHYRFRRRDDQYADVLDRTHILRDPTGRPVRVVGGLSDITQRLRAERDLDRYRQQLRALSARLQSAREEERSQIAREIHDELGQLLTALKLDLDRLEDSLGERSSQDASLNPLLERLVETGEMVETALTAVQRIAAELRPVTLDTLGLATTIQQEATRFADRTGLACPVELPTHPLALNREVTIAVYRIFQEALTNVARHAEATQVRIHLEQDANGLKLAIRDNGRGIDPNALYRQTSLGLLGMRERAAFLGGDVSIEPTEPSGTEVVLRLPTHGPHPARASLP